MLLWVKILVWVRVNQIKFDKTLSIKCYSSLYFRSQYSTWSMSHQKLDIEYKKSANIWLVFYFSAPGRFYFYSLGFFDFSSLALRNFLTFILPPIFSSSMNSFKTSSSSSSSSTSHMPLPVKCDSHVQAFCLASWDIKPKSCCQSSFRWRPWVTLWSWSMFVISLLNFLLLMLWPLCISELSPHIQKPLCEFLKQISLVSFGNACIGVRWRNIGVRWQYWCPQTGSD